MEISLKGKKINTWLLILIFVLIVALLIFLMISLKLEKNANLENQEPIVNQEDFLENQDQLETIFNREAYLRENISKLSAEPEVLGGSFYITSIQWPEKDQALIEYEDGHIALEANVYFAADSLDLLSFEIINQEE